ncbi:MAG: ATP synthase F1 subunit delta [Candidatus Velamenicoccus archaeovorus]
MSAEKTPVIRGYAEALFTIAGAEGELSLVEDELYAFAKALEGQPRLADALADPALPAENKKALLRDVLGETPNPLALNALCFLIDQGRGRDITAIVETLAEVSAESRRHVVAEVRSAVPMNQRQRDELAEALSRATGKTVEVKVVVDPSVVAGVVARVGDEVFDGTVRNRLQEARRQLAGA